MVGREDLVDSVIADATIYDPSGSLFGAIPGPQLGAPHLFHTFFTEPQVWKAVLYHVFTLPCVSL